MLLSLVLATGLATGLVHAAPPDGPVVSPSSVNPGQLVKMNVTLANLISCSEDRRLGVKLPQEAIDNGAYLFSEDRESFNEQPGQNTEFDHSYSNSFKKLELRFWLRAPYRRRKMSRLPLHVTELCGNTTKHYSVGIAVEGTDPLAFPATLTSDATLSQVQGNVPGTTVLKAKWPMACKAEHSPHIRLTVDGSKYLAGLSPAVSPGYEGKAEGYSREFKVGADIFQGHSTLVYTSQASTRSNQATLNFSFLLQSYQNEQQVPVQVDFLCDFVVVARSTPRIRVLSPKALPTPAFNPPQIFSSRNTKVDVDLDWPVVCPRIMHPKVKITVAFSEGALLAPDDIASYLVFGLAAEKEPMRVYPADDAIANRPFQSLLFTYNVHTFLEKDTLNFKFAAGDVSPGASQRVSVDVEFFCDEINVGGFTRQFENAPALINKGGRALSRVKRLVTLKFTQPTPPKASTAYVSQVNAPILAPASVIANKVVSIQLKAAWSGVCPLPAVRLSLDDDTFKSGAALSPKPNGKYEIQGLKGMQFISMPNELTQKELAKKEISGLLFLFETLPSPFVVQFDYFAQHVDPQTVQNTPIDAIFICDEQIVGNFSIKNSNPLMLKVNAAAPLAASLYLLLSGLVALLAC